MKHNILNNTLGLCILLFCFYHNLFCQSTINVIESKTLEQISINDTIFQKFSGNVIIEYSDLKIVCDTIMIDEHQYLVKGWGNTHIFNDTLSCHSDSINIKTNLDEIIFYQNTVLKTNNMEIGSDEVIYNYENNEIQYFKSGSVKTTNYNINSIEFSHKLHTKNSYFNKNVELKNEDYYIISENIHQLESKIIFCGNTSIKHIDFKINCKNGFLEKEKTLELFDGVTVYFDNQAVTANRLTRNIQKEENYFENDVHIVIDETTHIFGEELCQINNTSTITKNSYIKLFNEKDTTFIKAKTIKIDQDENLSLDKNITIYNRNLEGKCDAMDFQANDKKINMNTNPVLWFKNIQITGEQIQLYTSENSIDSIYIPTKPFIISKVDSSKHYDQITGKELEGKIKNNQIQYAKISGNGELIYFKQNKKNTSFNHIQASSIKLFFTENNIQEVLCIDEIDSKYKEIDTIDIRGEVNPIYLDGFKLETNNVNTLF